MLDAADDETVRDAIAQLRERLHEPADVLHRIDAPDIQNEPLREVVARPRTRQPFGIFNPAKVGSETVIDGSDLRRRKMQSLDGDPGRIVRHGDDPGCLAAE
jgi:hypothetical protein